MSRWSPYIRASFWLPVLYFVQAEICTVASVSGRSMQPTLNPDDNRLGRDYIFVDRLSVWLGRLKRGDVVLMWSPDQVNTTLVKRLVALPGDVVKPFNDPDADYTQIPAGHCWVEGDEPFHGRDSNVFGAVPLSLVTGRVPFVVFPTSRFGRVADRSQRPGLPMRA